MSTYLNVCFLFVYICLLDKCEFNEEEEDIEVFFHTACLYKLLVSYKNMEIKSVFKNNGKIPLRYSCKGADINPKLEFKDIPEEAESLALIMHDPDAPMDGGFTHWVLFNMLSNTKIIEENSVPKGVQGVNGANTNKYLGPCPPSGTHRYFFKLYALDTSLDLDESAGKNEVEEAIKGHVIEEAELMGLFP